MGPGHWAGCSMPRVVCVSAALRGLSDSQTAAVLQDTPWSERGTGSKACGCIWLPE